MEVKRVCKHSLPGERGRITDPTTSPGCGSACIAAFNLPSTPRLQHAPTDSTESADQTKAAYTSYSRAIPESRKTVSTICGAILTAFRASMSELRSIQNPRIMNPAIDIAARLTSRYFRVRYMAFKFRLTVCRYSRQPHRPRFALALHRSRR